MDEFSTFLIVKLSKKLIVIKPIRKTDIFKDGVDNKQQLRESLICWLFVIKKTVILNADNFYSSDVMKYPCSNSTLFGQPNWFYMKQHLIVDSCRESKL